MLHQALVWQTGRRLRAQQPKGQKLKQVTVDVDGLPVEVHGHQEGSAYNGHCGVRMYHPIVASRAETGDLLDVRLREGNVHSAMERWNSSRSCWGEWREICGAATCAPSAVAGTAAGSADCCWVSNDSRSWS